MNAKEPIKYMLAGNHGMLKSFLSDLSDSDLLVRPAPNANHAAWQLGHLITSEVNLLRMIGLTPVSLPAGFAEKHSKETASSDSPSGFLKKAEYLELADKVRYATLAELENLSDAGLDKPTTGPMAQHAPNAGSMFVMIANHTMMHAGQFTVLRRKLGKPILF
jgi:DinB superfamily